MFTESRRRSAALLRELAHQWETGAIDWREYRAARASLLAAEAASDPPARHSVDGTHAASSTDLSYEKIAARERHQEPQDEFHGEFHGERHGERHDASGEPRILSFEDFRRQRRPDRFETREGGRRRAG
jgi:hypothetical protein